MLSHEPRQALELLRSIAKVTVEASIGYTPSQFAFIERVLTEATAPHWELRDRFANSVLMGTIANGSLGRLIQQLGGGVMMTHDSDLTAGVAAQMRARYADVEATATRQIAEACYEMADAMLEARDRKDGE